MSLTKLENAYVTAIDENARRCTDESYGAYERASDAYKDLCGEMMICTAIGCRTYSDWCAWCDDHCIHDDHVPHAECRDDE